MQSATISDQQKKKFKNKLARLITFEKIIFKNKTTHFKSAQNVGSVFVHVDGRNVIKKTSFNLWVRKERLHCSLKLAKLEGENWQSRLSASQLLSRDTNL